MPWSATGGAALCVALAATATTRAYARQGRTYIFLGENTQVSPLATALTSNGLEQNAIAHKRQAIGFVSFAYTGGTNAVGYQGVSCNLRNAKSGQYAGLRNFWFVTVGTPKGAIKKFIDFARSPAVQSGIVAKHYVTYQ